MSNLVGTHDVRVVGSAGVSPGNDKLAKDYAAVFPKTPEWAEDYQVYNTIYYNEMDTVPQAWSINSSDDRNLYNILGKIFHFSDDLRPFAELISTLAIWLPIPSKIQYVPLPGQKFTGPSIPEPIQSWDQFSDVLHSQHVQVYLDKIGINGFIERFERSFSLIKGAKLG